MAIVSTLLTAIGYGLNRIIDANSEPTAAECIQWMNQTLDWILQTNAELGSELGRTTGTITTTDGTASYSDLATNMYCPAVMVDGDGNNFCGWIVKTNSRDSLKLVTEAKVLDYDPSSDTDEPTEFYIDGSNNVIFLQTPDATYTIKIPYYQTQSVSTSGDTVPFLAIFDNLIIESIVTKYLYRTREDAGIEWNWFSFVKTRAQRIIQLRKRMPVRIS